MKKWLSIILVLVMALSLLAGCGGKSTSAENGTAYNDRLTGSSVLADEAGSGAPELEYSSSSSSSQSSADNLPQNQKMVRKIWLDAETEDLTSLLSNVEQRISELGGYIESQNLQNGSKYSGSRRYRYADLTVRIPADKLDEFVDQVAEASNIVSKRQTAENITLSYVATQSRVTALETEQTRLLELLAQAENMTDVLSIEKRLTEVRADLEEYTSQLRVFDNQVDYGTVYLNISEVVEFTDTEEPETVWERIGAGFMESLENLGDFFVELFVFLIVASPYLIPLGLVIAGIVFLIRKKSKKQKKHTIKTDFPDENAK